MNGVTKALPLNLLMEPLKSWINGIGMFNRVVVVEEGDEHLKNILWIL